MAAEPRYLLGLDLGTSSCKAILFDTEGCPKASADAEVEVIHPKPTWAVGEPERWWEVAAAVMREVMEGSGVPPAQIAAVGLSGLMHAPVLLDEHGSVVEQAILWMDQRCRPQCEWLRAHHEALFRRETGGAPNTSSSAGKLLWLAEHRPEVIRRTRRLMLPKDYLRYRLCGDWATDPGDGAGTGLMNRRRDEWSPELVKLVGFPVEAMPPLRPSWEIRGEVTDEAGRECELAAGTPVVCGSNDVSCTLRGADAWRPGQITLYLGTAAWICHGQGEGRPRFLGFAATSASCLRWWRDTFGGSDSYEELVRQVEDTGPAPGGLLFFPHLMGERGPVADPRAKGGFLGLTLAHRAPDMLRAVMEGVGYHVRQIIEAGDKPEGELVTVGGGARSRIWLQTIADITGRRVRRAAVIEAAAFGAAMLAAVGLGMFSAPEEASSRWVRGGEAIEPRQDLVARYDQVYQLWQDADAALQRFYPRFPEEDGQ